MFWIWNELLFRPLLNLLIGLYNTVGLQNLGYSIIWLTMITRFVLLPFSYQAERQRKKKQEVEEQLGRLQKSFSNNPSVLRQEQRKLFKQLKYRRWPKILTMAIQGVILLLLYQVFVGGIKLAEIVDSLYSWVHVPRSINTIFFGIDLAQTSFLLSFIPALILAFTIIADHGGVRARWTSRDLVLLVGFPLGTFLFLFYLPSVKAIFILSSQLFGLTLRILTNFFESIAHQDRLISEEKAAKKAMETEGKTKIKSRF